MTSSRYRSDPDECNEKGDGFNQTGGTKYSLILNNKWVCKHACVFKSICVFEGHN